MKPTLVTLAPSFARHLAASNRSPRTIKTYMSAIRALAKFIEAHGLRGEVSVTSTKPSRVTTIRS